MPFVTLNKYVNAERSNRFMAAKIKKDQTNSVAYLALEQCDKRFREVKDIKFTWYKPNNRTDHDNIAFAKKFILDGLIKAGILKDDSPKYVRNFQDVFILDKTRDYISCTIELT